jgi:hypothetical protein
VREEGTAYGMAKTFSDAPLSQDLYEDIADLIDED